VRLWNIALRNVRRHVSRSALMVLVIAAAVAVVTTLYLSARNTENDLAKYSGGYAAFLLHFVAMRRHEASMAIDTREVPR
jgi:F0F1-type ATP synthase assembly protein I